MHGGQVKIEIEKDESAHNAANTCSNVLEKYLEGFCHHAARQMTGMGPKFQKDRKLGRMAGR